VFLMGRMGLVQGQCNRVFSRSVQV
jgi:hypothetical protein